MRKQGLPLQRLLGGDVLPTVASDLHLTDVTALYVEVGEGRVSAQSVVQKVMAAMGGTEGAVEDIAETAVPTRAPRAVAARDRPGVVVKGAPDVWVKLARCCTPVPGDDIVGFVTRGRGVSVHRGDCVNAGPLLATGSASWRSSGRPRPARCSSWRSRSRRSTARGCCPT